VGRRADGVCGVSVPRKKTAAKMKRSVERAPPEKRLATACDQNSGLKQTFLKVKACLKSNAHDVVYFQFHFRKNPRSMSTYGVTFKVTAFGDPQSSVVGCVVDGYVL
jgi:hypothetical protein